MRLFCTGCQKAFSAEKPADSDMVKCPNCGVEQRYPAEIPGPGVVLGDFLIEKLLSRGGMGEVFLARQISLDRPVALKVLQQKHLDDREYVASLLKEARAAAKLNHPNIVQAYAVGEENGIFYFAMEYIRGETFKQILKREKIIEFTRAATVIRDIARALDTAWREQKLVHQDIKPDNIMLDANGFAKLADLGLAKVATGGPEESADEGDEVLGTPQYISPEQLTGVPTDVRSDIYSLGATFYHFVTGRFPYVADTGDEIARMHVEGTLQPPKEVNPQLPDALNTIILKMMERDINRRYQSPEPLIRALNMYLRGVPATDGSAVPKLNIKTPPKRGLSPASAASASSAVPKLSVPAGTAARPPELKVPGGAPGVPKAPNVPKAPSVPKAPNVPETTNALGGPEPADGAAGGDAAEEKVSAATENPEIKTGAAEVEKSDSKRRLRRGLRIAIVPIALLGLIWALLVICHKLRLLPEPLQPLGRMAAGAGDTAKNGSTETEKPSAGSRKGGNVPPPPPPVAAVKTRPEYVAKIAEILKLRGTSGDPERFMAAADAFFASGKPPQTAEERMHYWRLVSAFAPLDEERRFAPFRREARQAHVDAIAAAERLREQERRQAEMGELEAERRRAEMGELEAERRRFQEEQRRQVLERTGKLRGDMRAVMRNLVSGFYAATGGDKAAFDTALNSANNFFIPASSTSPEEKKLIDEFCDFRRGLPTELEKLLAFQRLVANIPGGFSYPATRLGIVQVVSLLPDGRVIYRAGNGRNMRLPDLSPADHRRLMLVLAKHTGNPHAAFYYALMTRQFTPAAVKNAPPVFWRKHIKLFRELMDAK